MGKNHNTRTSIHSKYARGDIIDNPVHSCQQVGTSHSTAVLNEPVMSFNGVQIQMLSFVENTIHIVNTSKLQ